MIHEDKRRFMRMNVNTQATITVLDTGQKLQAHCQDLSATGMSLLVSEPVEVNAMLEVYIDSSGSTTPPLSAHARVLRVTQEGDGEYIVGVEISKFN
ncbi:PilZ domain-containing protein [Pseudoalteromonas xiamenensis]|uniref:PilZ domain-containing protein n=1 Tax=Pseudoalteromonas xiamenensis TaxID=882626 RepID=UPI0027E3D03B|nr:PilZ domain-containing protein [Pseudoalteromonas xiamenensis]WMN60389.1 PilZ domain-containing protein [Pseudoalteromonas xiamenensis]